MEFLVEIIKEYFLPGSLPLFIFAMSIGVIMLFRSEKWKKWGRRWLCFLLLAYWIMSMPLFTRAIESLLTHGYQALDEGQIPHDVDTVVILGGGSSTFRLGEFEQNVLSEEGILRSMEGARLYYLLDDPLLIVSGGTNDRTGLTTPESEPLQEALVSFGVPASYIVLESDSGDTYEQALNLENLLGARGNERFIMVTSPTHMWRAVATFEAQGLHPIPAISAQHGLGFLANEVLILPNADALHASRMAMREIFATLYYALAGRF